ncbi:hypothetical protein F4775DRAFT_427416 [Biscogniauxia sp. FL1348]|nr:hypothetical protein F4775DRAFT_427416 [Biscogniauxia sp. FL1348]
MAVALWGRREDRWCAVSWEREQARGRKTEECREKERRRGGASSSFARLALFCLLCYAHPSVAYFAIEPWGTRGASREGLRTGSGRHCVCGLAAHPGRQEPQKSLRALQVMVWYSDHTLAQAAIGAGELESKKSKKGAKSRWLVGLNSTKLIEDKWSLGLPYARGRDIPKTPFTVFVGSFCYTIWST